MTIQEYTQMTEIINPKRSFWILSGFTALAVMCLALAELPTEWWTRHAIVIVTFISAHIGLELLRAAVLIVNVQILRSAGSQKYYIVLAMTIAATVGIAISIYHNHAGNWSDPFMWTSQVLNFIVLSGELSLSFLLAGRKIDYPAAMAEMEETLEGLRDELGADRETIELLSSEIETLRNTLGGVRKEIGKLRPDIESNSDAIGILSELVRDVQKANREAKERDRQAEAVVRIHSGYEKITIDGFKARACKCGTMTPAPSNKVMSWPCANCSTELN